VFNIFPTIFEVLLVSGILVSFLYLEKLAIKEKQKQNKKKNEGIDDHIHNSMEYSSGDKIQ